MDHVAHLQRMANESWRGSPEHAALTVAIASLSDPKPEDTATKALEYVFGLYTDWGRVVEEKLTPPCPLMHHARAMGLFKVKPPAEAQAQGGGEVVTWWNPDAEFSDPFSQSQTRKHRIALYAAPPSAPVGECPDCTNSQQCNSCSRDEQAVLESSVPVGVEAAPSPVRALMSECPDCLNDGCACSKCNPHPGDQQPAAVEGSKANARVMGCGFERANGKAVPTVLVGFPVEDWKARDAFAAALAQQPATWQQQFADKCNAFRVGQAVRTPWGEGIVERIDPNWNGGGVCVRHDKGTPCFDPGNVQPAAVDGGARLDAERMDAIKRLRLAVTPVEGGGWDVSVFGAEDCKETLLGSGADVRSAIDEAVTLAAQQGGA